MNIDELIAKANLKNKYSQTHGYKWKYEEVI